MLKINAFHFAKLIKELRDGPYSYQEMAEHTGLHYTTVREYVNALRKEREVHIACWDKDSRGRDNTAQWLLGPGVDKKRRAMTHVERSARYRLKRKAMARLHIFTPKGDHGLRSVS